MASPRVALLMTRLMDLSRDFSVQLDSLNKRLNQIEEPLVLLPARHNIVDKKKDKLRHQKMWKVELKDILTTPVDAVEIRLHESS